MQFPKSSGKPPSGSRSPSGLPGHPFGYDTTRGFVLFSLFWVSSGVRDNEVCFSCWVWLRSVFFASSSVFVPAGSAILNVLVWCRTFRIFDLNFQKLQQRRLPDVILWSPHFIYRCFCSVIWVSLMARVALRTVFGTAFPEAARIVTTFYFGGIFGNLSIQEVYIKVSLNS